MDHDFGWRRPVSHHTGFLLYCSHYLGPRVFFFFWPQYLKWPLEQSCACLDSFLFFSCFRPPRKATTSLRRESSEWTKLARPLYSIALCTKCPTTALVRCRYALPGLAPTILSKVVSRWFSGKAPLIVNDSIPLPSWTSGRRRASTGRATPRSATRT